MATWVIGDIHGCYDDFQAILNNPEVKEDDTIILIGDIIDRGPDSYKMIKWAMDNVTDNGKYQMILGNHEDNIIFDYRTVKRRVQDVQMLKTLDIALLNCHYDFTEYMYRAGFETVYSVYPIVKFFDSLPLYKEVTVKDSERVDQKYIIAHAWFKNEYKEIDLKDPIKLEERNTVIWFRDVDGRSNNLLNIQYDGEETLIHGHTPTLLISLKDNKERMNTVITNGNIINIDCGCVFKYYGGNLAAIRLEDKKVIYSRELTNIVK